MAERLAGNNEADMDVEAGTAEHPPVVEIAVCLREQDKFVGKKVCEVPDALRGGSCEMEMSRNVLGASVQLGLCALECNRRTIAAFGLLAMQPDASER